MAVGHDVVLEFGQKLGPIGKEALGADDLLVFNVALASGEQGRVVDRFLALLGQLPQVVEEGNEGGFAVRSVGMA